MVTRGNYWKPAAMIIVNNNLLIMDIYFYIKPFTDITINIIK